MAIYVVILDNHRREDGTLTVRYRRDRMEGLLEGVGRDWPESAPKPVVLVGGEDGMDHHEELVS